MGSAKEVIDKYLDHLPMKWLNCPVRGQIPQRNYALQELPTACKVVFYFDDDILLENNAIEEIVNF